MKKVDFRALANTKKKIDSPLAKYNNVGQLYCVLCNTPVKNEMLWTGHVNGKAHREALANLKAAGAGAVLSTPAAGKRPAPAAPPNPAARTSEQEFLQPPPVKKPALDMDPSWTFKVPSMPPPKPSTNSLHANLASDKNGHKDEEEEEEVMEEDDGNDNAESEKVKQSETPASSQTNAAQLPAGFFDDPKEDAKARGLEWRNPEEIEWERFMKEIAGEEVVSSTMRTMDDEESTKSRELEEIEEQMAHWQKVVDLERKVEAVRKEQQKQREAGASSKTPGDDSDEELEYDEDLDWRAKRH